MLQLIFVDSRGPWDTITTLHGNKEFRLRKTVVLIRDSFESRDFDELTCIRGMDILSDALRNLNLQSWDRLETAMSSGILCKAFKEACTQKSSKWKYIRGSRF